MGSSLSVFQEVEVDLLRRVVTGLFLLVVPAVHGRHSAARDQLLDPVAVIEELADAGGSRRRRTHEANLGLPRAAGRHRHTGRGGAFPPPAAGPGPRDARGVPGVAF